MRKLLPLLAVCLSTAFSAASQCATNYSQAKLDWDKKSFISTVGYATGYLSTTMCTNQNFAFGAILLNITHNYPITASTSPNDNDKHTGHVGSYGWGEDVEFIGNGKITLTFSSPVYSLKFSLQDIEEGQKASVTAFNGTTPLPVTMTACAGGATKLTITNPISNNPIATGPTGNGNAGVIDNALNLGSVNVDIAGPVTGIVIDISLSTGGQKNNDDVFLSDISACAPGSFPSNYQQTGSNQPFIGQADYFITTPDNNSAYMVDPATGRAWHLFTEPNATYINSFAYDPYSKVLYYVVDGSTNPAANKKIRKYDFNTETASDFITDVTAYGIPTFNQGVESAAASFYDGALYLGIEGGTEKESIVWRININNGVPSQAYQVFATPTGGHDWGDFIVKDGTLFDFNTSQSGTSQFKHHTLMTDSLINYSTPSAGQAGMTWAGDLFSIRNVVEKYNEDGTKGTAKTVTVVRGPAWVGNSGDASGPFKPKADFGDAPSSYDPIALSPAVHEIDSTLRIGATLDREWAKSSSINASSDGSDEDGLISGRIMNLNNGNYLAQVSVYNHTGQNATVAAWVDFNSDGIFQPEEGTVATSLVSSSTSTQTVDLFWNNITTNLASNSNTFLRVRITSSVNNMTVNSPTGYFPDGEVEDHYVIVNTAALAVNDLKFEASKVNGSVQLTWELEREEKDVVSYKIQKSLDGRSWFQISTLDATGKMVYSVNDQQPSPGASYYRIEVQMSSGRTLISETKKIVFDAAGIHFTVLSNPIVSVLKVEVRSNSTEKVNLILSDNYGNSIISRTCNISKGATDISIPVAHLPGGQYYIQILSKSYTDQKKIVLIK